jgi:predicted RecB family endonuclease
MASDEARKELQANQSNQRQEDHRNRELEPHDLQHKPVDEELRQRIRELEEQQRKSDEQQRKSDEQQKKVEEALMEEQRKRKELEEQISTLRSRVERPSTPTNQGIPNSDGRLSIASSIFRDQLLTDIF